MFARLTIRSHAHSFNEATGADPVDACPPATRSPRRDPARFNEATGADPVDAHPMVGFNPYLMPLQ